MNIKFISKYKNLDAEERKKQFIEKIVDSISYHEFEEDLPVEKPAVLLTVNGLTAHQRS